MTNFSLSARLRKRIAREMAAGKYRSTEQMMVQALDALADRRCAVQAIARGLEDIKADRMRSWRDCKRDALKRRPDLAK
jgi:hypothetical protein